MREVHRLLTMAMLFAAALVPVQGRAQAAAPDAPAERQVQIQEVRVGLTEAGPVVLLVAEGRAIPVYVDPTVANSIQGALTGQKTPRPMSHDLMREILQTLGARVTQAVITLKDSTYYGALSVAFKEEVKVFDSRSSDAIALAVHFKAPIFVGRELLNSTGIPLVPGSISM